MRVVHLMMQPLPQSQSRSPDEPDLPRNICTRR